ncbi:Hypothetical predicted protein [Mytilus galloprovincialis]|uniref:TNFR-Cys domain-containing protein n=1 Tax=Mytilus galloprovincialis TaxID=29158 RepID=A0A8B6E859_MYTGA|nr:Hypothetical predicted protein [Mytilus galloprovincialis]
MFFLCDLPFVVFISIQCFKLSFGQFCYDIKPNGREVRYCCANSELKNGQCVECKIGFYTEAGGSCKPCNTNYYGYKCIEYCICRQNQICDNVFGCIDVTVSTDTYYITTDFIIFSTEATLSKNTEMTTESATFHATYETTIQHQQENESQYTTARIRDKNHVTHPLVVNSVQDQSVISITKQQLIIFSLSAVGFFLLLGLLFLCWRYKEKAKSRHITNLSLKDQGEFANRDKNEEADFNKDNKSNTSCSFESLYDEIDESSMIKSFKRLQIISQISNPYLDVIDEPKIPTKNKNQLSVSSCYLTPVTRNEKSKHLSDNTYIDVISGSESPKSCQSTTSDESNYLTPVNSHRLDNCIGSLGSDTCLNDEGDYLQPYTSVLSTQIYLLQENADFSKNHQAHDDNSYSNDELNEHKYSHLYQQLNDGWETKPPTYMTTFSKSRHDATETDASTPYDITPSKFPNESVPVTDRNAPSGIVQNKDLLVKEDNVPSSNSSFSSLKEGVTVISDNTTLFFTSCHSSNEDITITDNIETDNSDPLLDISHRNENQHDKCSIICDMEEHSFNCTHEVSLKEQETNISIESYVIIPDKVTDDFQSSI